MKIGIYGGSFNPIHKGHIYVANAAIEQFHLDKLMLMPSFYSPNKAGTDLIDSIHRLNMCEIVSKFSEIISVSDYEIKKEGISYTYLTLEHFATEYKDDELFFIMGADSVDYLEDWKHPELICKYAKILVIPREGYENELLQDKISHLKQLYSCEIFFINVNKYNASSTNIRRELLNAPNSCPNALDESVYDYIKKNNLYGV